MTPYRWKQLVPTWNALLDRGLCIGTGHADEQMCVEAAITVLLKEPFGDRPSCVAASVRAFKIRLNDNQHWASPQSRANGLRKLGLAQTLKSPGVKALKYLGAT